MTGERVHQVMEQSSQWRFVFCLNILEVGTYYGILRYSLQSPDIQDRYKWAAERGAQLKQRLRDILERAGVIIDDQGSFADEKNWKAICRLRGDNGYEIELDNLDVMLTHGLIRTWDMYPPDWEPEYPAGFQLQKTLIKWKCQKAFGCMGFTPEEIEYMDTATDDERADHSKDN